MAHLYLFTHAPLPSSFCIILSACLLIFTLFPLLQLLHQFIILSAFLRSLLGVEHPPSASKDIALSLGPSLEDLPLLVFLHEGRTMLNKPRYDICYMTVYVEKDGVTPVLYLHNSEILGNYLLVKNFCNRVGNQSLYDLFGRCS